MNLWWIRIGSIRGAAVRVHASLLLWMMVGIVVYENAPLGALGISLLILVHELGHACVAWAHRVRVVRISITPIGGTCEHVPAGELASILIAWGGVAAQLVLFVVCYFAVTQGLRLPDAFMRPLLPLNLLIAVVNLLPIRSLDGATAWRIVPYVWRRLLATMRASRRRRDLSTLRRPPRGPFASANTREADDLVIEDDEAIALAERLEQSRRRH